MYSFQPTVPVAPRRPTYTGPLARFLKKQAEVKEARTTATQLATMRANVLALVEDPHLFSEAERTRAAANVAGCHCLAQLQRWFRNVYRLLKERETSLHMAFADGSYTHLSVTA